MLIVNPSNLEWIHRTKKHGKNFLNIICFMLVKKQLKLRRRASEDGRQPHAVGSKCKAFVAQSAKVPPTKKDPKVFLVLVVGLEPTRSPTRPLNVRVCHSATPASIDYVSIIFFCCQEILKKKFTFSFFKKTN